MHIANCKLTLVGANYDEVPPVPIPNTEVKLISAEDTWRAAAWENRSVPVLKYKEVAMIVNIVAAFLYFSNKSPKTLKTIGIAQQTVLYTNYILKVKKLCNIKRATRGHPYNW